MDGSGTISISDSFNVDSITDDGTGTYTVTWDTDFADTNYCATGMAARVGGNSVNIAINSQAVGSMQVECRNVSAHAQVDPTIVNIMAIGDQS